jgi:hypothetical protein
VIAVGFDGIVHDPSVVHVHVRLVGAFRKHRLGGDKVVQSETAIPRPEIIDHPAALVTLPCWGWWEFSKVQQGFVQVRFKFYLLFTKYLCITSSLPSLYYRSFSYICLNISSTILYVLHLLHYL